MATFAALPRVAVAGSKRQSFTVPPNPSEYVRTLEIDVNGQKVAITQAGLSGCFPISSGPVYVPAEGITGTATQSGCAWQARSSAPWVQIYPLSGELNASVQYTVFPNFGLAERYASVMMGDQGLGIVQAGASGSETQRFIKLLYFNFFGRLPLSLIHI